jgi:hypothetical protein
MNIEEYGFKGFLSYRKAHFVGTGRRRRWEYSTIDRINIYSPKQVRDFLRKNDLAELLMLKLSISYHGHVSFSASYHNIYLNRLKEAVSAKSPLSPLRYKGITKEAVLSQIDNGIKNSSECVKMIRESLEKSSVSAGSSHLRGRGIYYMTHYETYVHSNNIDYYAIPDALEDNKKNFKKAGPKPDTMALYHKRHRSFS